MEVQETGTYMSKCDCIPFPEKAAFKKVISCVRKLSSSLYIYIYVEFKTTVEASQKLMYYFIIVILS